MAQRVDTFTIALGGTTSNSIDMNGRAPVKWSIPIMTGTSIAIQEKNEAGDFVAVYDDSETALTLTGAAAARIKKTQPGTFTLSGEIRLVSNGTEAAERKIYCYSDSFID